MAGITLYGCEGGKPHCREYLQIQLREPLVVGQRYEMSLWVNHIPRSIHIDGLSVLFSRERPYNPTDALLEGDPQVIAEGILDYHEDWQQVKREFVAKDLHEFITIGNFLPDSLTGTRGPREFLQFAYYYIDDVSLIKLPPILEVPIPEDDLSRLPLKTGSVIRLNNIYFDHDRSDFLPRSYRELNTLLQIMQDNPQMEIEIHGHTDSSGTDSYNKRLSTDRAQAVVKFLRSHGVEAERTRYQGYGSSKPVASNAHEYGRSKNRRVECHILKY